MKINKFNVIMLAILSCQSLAAFNENEVAQLSAINVGANNNFNKSLKKLKSAIDKAIDNNPEKKQSITSLDERWGELTIEKCNFETLDSKGTEAELSLKFNCMTRENDKEALYFNSLLP